MVVMARPSSIFPRSSQGEWLFHRSEFRWPLAGFVLAVGALDNRAFPTDDVAVEFNPLVLAFHQPLNPRPSPTSPQLCMAGRLTCTCRAAPEPYPAHCQEHSTVRTLCRANEPWRYRSTVPRRGTSPRHAKPSRRSHRRCPRSGLAHLMLVRSAGTEHRLWIRGHAEASTPTGVHGADASHGSCGLPTCASRDQVDTHRSGRTHRAAATRLLLEASGEPTPLSRGQRR